jgi:hypothetical protein
MDVKDKFINRGLNNKTSDPIKAARAVMPICLRYE